MRYPGALVLLFLSALQVQSLVFPLPPNERGDYDPNFNTIPSYETAWTREHFIFNLHGVNAVAIAPRWILSAWHATSHLDENAWANDGHDRYYLRDKVQIGFDLALIRVDRALPGYSMLRKTPVLRDEIITVYGNSAAAADPLYNPQGEHCGWRVAPLEFEQRLRWGEGRAEGKSSGLVEWLFSRGDEALGADGLNCAGVATNDSGGGIFTGSQLAAITVGGSFSGYRTNLSEPIGSCEQPGRLVNAGHFFNTNGFFECGDNRAFGDQQRRATGSAVYPSLSNIFAIISPAIRLSAGGTAFTNETQAWRAWPGDSPEIAKFTSGASVETNGLPYAAPPSIYSSELFVTGKPQARISFAAEELIRYERYNVRLHFSSLNTASAPGRSLQILTVNGESVLFDPYSPSGATNFLFLNIAPDEDDRITVTVAPANDLGLATISGLEIDLIPSWPTAPPPFSWETLNRTASNLIFDTVAYGNGIFFGFGQSAVYSPDLGATWLPSYGFLSPTFDPVIAFGNGKFVSTSGAGYLLVSQDARTWNTRLLPGGLTAFGVLFGNGVFLASAPSNQAFVSSDAAAWTKVQQPPGGILSFSDGAFLKWGLETVYASRDAIAWTSRPVNLPPPYNPGCPPGTNCLEVTATWSGPFGFASGNGLFAATLRSKVRIVTASSTNVVDYPVALISSDAATWRYPGDGSAKTNYGGSLRFLNDRFLLSNRWTTNFVDFSPWPVFALLQGVAFGASNWVVAGNPGVARSPSFERLKYEPRQVRQNIFGSVVNANATSAVLNLQPESPERILTYSRGEGLQPAILPPGLPLLAALRSTGSTAVAVGRGGTILVSRDLSKWQVARSESTDDLWDVIFSGDRWIVIGERGVLLASTDNASSFQVIPSPTNLQLRSICSGNGKLVAVGENGLIVRSLDGSHWETTFLPAADLRAVAHGNNRFVALSHTGGIFESLDGLDWRLVRIAPWLAFETLAFGNGIFAAGQTGSTAAAVSTDGREWNLVSLPFPVSAISSTDDTLWLSGPEAYLARPAALQIKIVRFRTNGVTLTLSATAAANHQLELSEGFGQPWTTVTNYPNSTTFRYSSPFVTTNRLFRVRRN